jgi:hypothetical protein
MKKILLLAILFPVYIGFSQSSNSDFRHETGFNFAPLITPLFVEDQSPNRLELSFLTHYENNWSLRLRLTAVNDLDGNHIHSNRPTFLIDTLSVSPTELNTRAYSQYFKSAIRFHAGFERNVRFEHLDLFGGLSAVISIENENSHAYNIDYNRPDTNSFYSRTISAYYGHHEVRSLALGVSPYLGVRVPIGNRFTLQFQSRIEYHYAFRTLQPFDLNTAYKSFRGRWSAYPLIGEIGVYWRF